VSSPIRPKATAHGALWPAMRGRPKGWLGLGLAARSGGALAGGPVAAGRRQGAAGEITGATGRALGKAVEGGAHPSGGTMERRWSMLRAVAFVGGDGASVAGGDGGTTLQCQCGRGKVRATSNGDNGGGWEVSP
jgi:hypothetical protein